MPFLIFILVPLAELAILIKLGDVIGIGATIALVILTAVIGVSLLKRQGLAALSRARASLDEGEFPVESVLDGACLLVAGAFLLTPGLLTDTLGFSLLIPPVRLAMARWVFSKFAASGNIHVDGMGPHGTGNGDGAPRPHDAPDTGGPVIEGEFEEPAQGEDGDDSGSRSDKERASSPWRK